MEGDVVNHMREIKAKPERLFVIGDVHGCLDDLKIMVDYIYKKALFNENDALIFIGDYVDRGPDSKGVIEYLISLKKESQQVYFLKGNHEDMLLSFMGFEGSGGHFYMSNGGAETLESYGLSRTARFDEVVAAMPASHLEFLQSLDRMIAVGDLLFVHAGLSPLRSIEYQMDEDIFWIRDEFIHNIHYFPYTVVFGHTPYQDVLFDLPYKIGIDTGLVYGNMLSCLVFGESSVLQLTRGSSQIRKYTFAEKGGEELNFPWQKDAVSKKVEPEEEI